MDQIVTKIRSTRGLSVKIANACGINRTAVYQWQRVPPERMAIVADIMDLRPEQIRPDLYRITRRL